MLTAESIVGGMSALIAVLGLVTLSLLVLRRGMRRVAARSETGVETVARIKDAHGAARVREAADQVLVQLEAVSREVNARLDTKFARLERVVRDADERIARLEQLLERTKREAVGAGPLARGNGPRRRKRRPMRRVDREPCGSDGGKGTGRGEDSPSVAGQRRAGEAEPSGTSVRARHEQVYDLFEAGSAPIQIAEALDLPLAEVELILSLREI